MNISVLGCGRWGSFIANYLAQHGNNVHLWGRSGGHSYENLLQTRKNDYMTLCDEVILTCDLDEALKSDIIVISILTKELDGFLKEVQKHLNEGNDKKIVFCMKGIDPETSETLTEIAVRNGFDENNLAVWVGPGHVQNFVVGVPSCMIISSYNMELAKKLQEVFSSDLIRFYINSDVIGVQIGAASKNVVGIMSGILDGLEWQGVKGALMARATYEYASLVEKMGGKGQTIYGLSHLGDYEATLFSPFSHNRMYGECLAKGVEYNLSAEGLYNVKGFYALSKKYDVDMPLTVALYNIIFEKQDIKEQIKQLFSREQKKEFCWEY